MTTGKAFGYEHEVACALQAARLAGQRLREAFHAGFKDDVDRPVELTIYDVLTNAYPQYGYRGEELGLRSTPRDPGAHLWLVDPQDGTSAARKGFRGAAVSIALLRTGRRFSVLCTLIVRLTMMATLSGGPRAFS